MIHKLSILAVLLAGFGLAWQMAKADDIVPARHAPPVCEPGYKIVEEVVYKDVVKTVCRMVPNVKTKWVYAVVDAPICVARRTPGSKRTECQQICRKVLVKKLVNVPCSTMKCVSEKIVERVPFVVYHKLPCDMPSAERLPAPPARK